MRRFWKRTACPALILCCMILSGCGGKEEGSTADNRQEETGPGSGETNGRTEKGDEPEESGPEGATGNSITYMDIRSETEELFVREGPEQENGFRMGLQYYQGEPVQLWGKNLTNVRVTQNGPLQMRVDVYLDRTDGSSELLAEKLIVGDRLSNNWFLDEEGMLYCVDSAPGRGTDLVRRDTEGQVLYEQHLDWVISDICQPGSGRIFVVLDDKVDANALSRLGELDPDTGAVTELLQFDMKIKGDLFLGSKADSLLVANVGSDGIEEVNLQDGTRTGVMTFSGTSYNDSFLWGEYGTTADFRMLEDGSLEILRYSSTACALEKLRLEEITKTPVVIRGYHFNNGWIKERVAEFNKTNAVYSVVLEEPGEGGDWGDFAVQTGIQISTGKGPDILYGAITGDYIQSMINKNGIEDLKPYLENSGLREEDYFPGAFMWREGEKIYGINVSLFSYRYSIDASVTGEGGADIETLVNALYSRQEKAVYMRNKNSGDILSMFLMGSDDFWGMINWEEGSCDFGGELFARMLEVAGRYPYDENLDYPVLAREIACDNLYLFDASSRQKESGTMTIGVLFDDGCYPALNTDYQSLSINANSAQKEGAWEFIRFLLSRESQEAIMNAAGCTPIQREAFEIFIQRKLEALEREGGISYREAYLNKGKYEARTVTLLREDVTEEWIEEFRQAAEDARALPIRTQPLLEMIREEAEDYFGGIKSIEEVIPVIENRVQLYLDENN